MQPDGVGIPTDKLIDIYSLDGGRPLDAFLFPADEDGHVFFTPSLPRSLFGGSPFSLGFFHVYQLPVKNFKLFLQYYSSKFLSVEAPDFAGGFLLFD
jgi:hypothetical protein